MSRQSWYSLTLAAIALKRDSLALTDLCGSLVTEFEDTSIRKIWRKAKLALQDIEIKWIEQQLTDNINA